MEDFVTFEQAKKLKELGFDWETDYLYSEYDKSRWHRHTDEQSYSNCISAPTLSQAQKWLKEEKEICVTSSIKIKKGKYKFNWDITLFKEGRGIWDESVIYDRYEDALSAGIDKALELLKQTNMEKKTGIELIAEERQRQIKEEGWTLEHDKQWNENNKKTDM